MEKIFKTWEETGINLKGKIKGEIKTICPQCPPDRGNPKDPSLSVNLDKQVWNCHYCNWSGGLSRHTFEDRKKYRKPEFTPETPSDKMAAWFLKYRGIERATLEKFLICPKKTYIHKTGKEENCIAFPYIRQTEIVNIKSRFDYVEDKQNKKTFALEKDCELIFYNLDSIAGKTHCVIVEGEIDCLTVWQATGFPCISVPNGASKGDNRMDYLDNCFNYFTDKTTILLATDNDSPGLHLREELARRLGKDRCYYVTYPDGCKDMNEVLLKHGPEMIEGLLSTPNAFPIEGVITLENVEEELDNYYLNGYPTGDTIGYPNFDKLIAFRGGEVTTITGIPGHGKSSFLDEILVRLSVRHKWNHGLFAAENGKPGLHYARLSARYIGKAFISDNEADRITPEEYGNAKYFLYNHFYFINTKEVNLTIDGLLEKGREMVLRKGIKSFVLDPFNCIESQRPVGVTESEYVGMIYTKLVNFAELYNVHVFLVAHPTKMRKREEDQVYEVPTLYNISGSANFFNKTFNGLTVYRDFKYNVTNVFVQKIKFDFIGELGMASFDFHKPSGRYSENNFNYQQA